MDFKTKTLIGLFATYGGYKFLVDFFSLLIRKKGPKKQFWIGLKLVKRPSFVKLVKLFKKMISFSEKSLKKSGLLRHLMTMNFILALGGW